MPADFLPCLSSKQLVYTRQAELSQLNDERKKKKKEKKESNQQYKQQEAKKKQSNDMTQNIWICLPKKAYLGAWGGQGYEKTLSLAKEMQINTTMKNPLNCSNNYC